jgi:protein SCO1
VKRRLLFVAAAVAVMLAGCHSGPKPDAPVPTASSTPGYKTYKMRGKVITTNAATSEVTVQHGAIAGFMDAMTMPYKVKDPNILTELHPGDTITADVLVSQHDDAGILLDNIVVVAQGKPDYKPQAVYHVPQKGDAVPDFAIRNQDGKQIHLGQFIGKQLLVTFIYTRCPLPNFCPRVTRNFADLHRRIAADPALAGKTHLLCVSFDPENDTPARLRAYGATYIGSDASSAFARWDFAVPDKPTLTKMAHFFDIGLTNEADNTITHTLSTTLIGADGRVERFYPGNEWTVNEVFADVKQSASKT